MVDSGKNKDFDSGEDLVSPVVDALKSESNKTVTALLQDNHPSDIAEILNLSDKSERSRLIALLGGEIDPEVLTHIDDSNIKDEIISLIGAESGAEAIGKLESDEAIQFIEDLSDERVEEILENLTGSKRLEVEEGLNYPEDSAGRLANKQFIIVGEKFNVGDVIDLIRKSKTLPDDFYTVFVVDEEGRPTSYIPLSRVMRNERNIKIKNIGEEIIKCINYTLDQEEVANIFRKYKLVSSPVVDEEGRMIGVITIDDIPDVLEEELEEDIMHLAGLGSETDIVGSPYKKFQNRSPWLFVNLITSIFASYIISFFEVEITQLVALAVLMPIVASMSGNAGAQTLTVAVRAIATKELTFANYRKVLSKELITSVINGFIFGFITLLASYILYENIQLGIVIFSAVVLTFFLASFSGCSIPLIMHKWKFDPAVSSSALVYAVTDISSFFIFLGLAALVLV
jgi:magnesium transporter